jgi:carbon monoxide dehydrogenase subunit G
MAQLERDIFIAASPDAVWSICGGIAAVGDWLPSAEGVRVEGDVRHVALDGGRGEIAERITLESDEEHRSEYEKVGEDGPLRVYRARFWVEAEGDGSRVHWAAEIEPGDGVGENELLAGVGASYESGLDNLRRLTEEG